MSMIPLAVLYSEDRDTEVFLSTAAVLFYFHFLWQSLRTEEDNLEVLFMDEQSIIITDSAL